MPRTKSSLLNDLSTADLKRLLAARERIDALEKEKAKLEKALGAIDQELARLIREATGPKPRKKTTRKKAATKKTARKKAGRKKAATKKATAKKTATKKAAAKKTAAAAGRKSVRKKAPARKVPARKKAGGGKATLEDVVATVIAKNKAPLTFKELFTAIVDGKLFRSKSKNFDNVLRRTLSTSRKIKRVGRGVYDVA